MLMVGTRKWVLIVAIMTATASCGDSGPIRSAAAFCGTLKSEKTRVTAQLNDTVSAGQASGDDLVAVLSTFGGSLQALGELRTYFAKLSAVAPNEIRTEVEIVAKSYDAQLDAASKAVSDPLGSLSSGLFSAMTTSGQMNSVDSYARTHCGEGI